VDVEDLLDEALVGVDRRVEEDEREGDGDRRRGGDCEPEKSPAEKLGLQGFQSSMRKSNNA
jgi:hypothetical protein